MPTPQEWRQRAEQWVPAFMAEHPDITNADVLFDQMRESDMYTPRFYVREEWGFRKAQSDYMDIVAMMGDEQRIPAGWKRQTAMNYREPLIWKVRLQGTLAETGQTVDRNITVEGDENLQIGPILDVAWGYAAMYGLNLYDAPPTITIIEALYA